MMTMTRSTTMMTITLGQKNATTAATEALHAPSGGVNRLKVRLGTALKWQASAESAGMP